MNSFNHYAYGSAVGWLYRTAAGIAPDPADPGFSSIVMKPKMDPRLGFVKASLRTRFGIVRSEWAYVGGRWVWSFSVPEGSRARVSVPGENEERVLGPGTYSFGEGGGRGQKGQTLLYTLNDEFDLGIPGVGRPVAGLYSVGGKFLKDKLLGKGAFEIREKGVAVEKHGRRRA